jgi:hypothetical protein
MPPRISGLTLVAALMVAMSPVPVRAFDLVKRHDVWSMIRGNAVSVFDPAHQRWIVYGGTSWRGDSRMRYLDLAGAPVWQLAFVQGAGPTHGLAAMIYDSSRNRLLYFQQGNATVYSLSLELPFIWSSFTPLGGVIPRYGMTGAYDPKRDRVVLYGGYDVNPYQPAILETRAGTYVLSLAGTPEWISANGVGTPPSSRADGAAAWDPTGDRMILYGGFYQDTFTPTRLRDTYTFSYVAGIPVWTNLVSASTPTALFGYPAAFDTLYQRFLLPYGGLLELADSANWKGFPSPPGAPYVSDGPIGVYDPVGQRYLYGGGIVQNAHGQQFPVGGFYQYALGASPGPGSRLSVAGDAAFDVTFGGYDGTLHRFVALAGGTPMTLSVDDTTWAPAGETEAGMPAGLRPLYDAGTNTLYALSPGDLYIVHPGPGASWSHVAIAPPVPLPFDRFATAFLDPSRQRILVIGQAQNAGGNVSAEFWQLALGPTPSWTKLADSTPLGARATAACVDLRRDRALFFGGRSLANAAPLGDLWALDLATLTFSQPAATGTAPSARLEVAAAYDSTRDRLIVTGDSLAGTFDLQFGAGDANGSWIRNDPAGPSLPSQLAGMGAFDRARDHLYVADPTRVYDITLGPYTRPIAVTRPAPRAWTPGAILGLGFPLVQGVAGTHTYAWSLRSDRAWSFFPLTGQVTIASPGPNSVGASVPVPDSAAAGVDSLRFEIHDIANAGIADSVVTWIVSPPPPPFWTLGEASVAGGAVHLRWVYSVPGAGPPVLQRRAGAGAWASIGTPQQETDGTAWYIDASQLAPGPYGYRVGISGTSQWSDEVVVTIPATATALWNPGTASVTSASIHVDWQLLSPRDGVARIERRAGSSAWGALADQLIAADDWVRFVDGAPLAPGSYGYRAGVPGNTGWMWSEEVFVDVPDSLLAWIGGDAEVGPDAVRISWHLTRALAGSARIQRRDPSGSWADKGNAPIAVDRTVEFEDRTVQPGHHYDYQAGVPDSAGWKWSNEVSVDIPAGPTTPLTLAFARPGTLVVDRALEIEFTVPRAGSARLEAFDLGGRRVASAVLQAYAPGSYSLRLDPGARAPSGIYFLRLVQAGQSVSKRAIVLGAH